ncbi:MAG: AAA family ATPase [Candidatus Heimdallarchaeota archaeon]|nr:AAA family ATPase [Candidatus Heimdallarchaeota archaeon]
MSSITTETQDNFIFHRLTLFNFKMHKHTELELSELPIIVISGANGSGKTQILEALILSIGHTPSRVSLSSYKDLVGPFDDHCIIQLLLNNPLINEQRLISSSDPEISNVVNKENFLLEIRINKEGDMKRYIIDSKNKKQQIARKQVQRLMKSIGIYDDTMLNFTEEGYLSSFADGSPRKKLESLLAATGLKEIFTSYLISKRRVDEKNKEFSPLILQLEKEKTKLQKLKENFERLEKKRELVTRFENVEKEFVWFNALESKRKLGESKREQKKKKDELSNLNIKILSTSETFEKIKSELEVLEKDNYNLINERDELSDKVSRFQGQKEEKERKIFQFKERINITNVKLEEFRKVKTNDNLNEKISLQDQLNSVKKQQKYLEVRRSDISKELREKNIEEESIKERINERKGMYGDLSEYERNFVKDTIKYKEGIKSTQYANEIIGPVYEVITILPEHTKYSEVIKQALGQSLFGFIATSEEAYKAAKEIYDNLFPSYKPNFTVGRVLEEEKGPKPEYLTSTELREKPEGVIDYVINLVDTSTQVKLYLKRFVNIVLAIPGLSPNLLTNYAKQIRANILTTDGKSYYLSREAFSRPPRKYHVKLNVSLDTYLSIERIRENLQSLYTSMEELVAEERQYIQELSELEIKKREIENSLRPWEISDDELEREFINLENNKNEIEQQLQEENSGLDLIETKINSLASKLVEMDIELKNKRGLEQSQRNEFSELSHHLTEFTSTKNRLIRHVELLNIEVEEINKHHKKLLVLAQEKGIQPEEMRENREEIFSEYSKIKGQLELLEITPEVTEETLNEQGLKVENLQIEVEENEKHLENLKKDLEKRLAEWEGSLHQIVSHLNKMLNLLLQNVFENISLSITNYNDESNAGLIIEAETKGDDRKYRQLSGGEKTLIAQAIILALHMINHSPIHAIDEFTQKLDRKNKSLAFAMSLATYKIAKENRSITPQFLLITPTLDDVQLSEEFTHKILIESKVIV